MRPLTVLNILIDDLFQGLRPESLLNILAIAPVDEYLYPGLRPEVYWHILGLGVLGNDLAISANWMQGGTALAGASQGTRILREKNRFHLAADAAQLQQQRNH